MSKCPQENILQAYLDGRLDPDRAGALRLHVAGCPPCQELLRVMNCLEIMDPLPAPDPPRQDPATDSTPAAKDQPVGPDALRFARDQEIAGRYRVLDFIDKGGMGQVYRVKDLELGETVALKTLLPWISGDPHLLERFRREVALAHRITHPNVCRIFDLGFHQSPGQRDVAFLTMELLSGQTLARCLRERGRMTIAQALPLVRQMTAALAAAHQQGIIHRDFKCGNVFLVPAGPGEERVVVTDFGLARGPAEPGDPTVTRQGELVGTPAYMAPEQVEGEEVTAATDIYALGVVLYEMVTGRLPFLGDTARATAFKRLKEPPSPPRQYCPELDQRWEAVILQCLEREPAARYQSAPEVAKALEGAAPARWWPPDRVVSAGVVLVALVFLAVGAASLLNHRRTRAAGAAGGQVMAGANMDVRAPAGMAGIPGGTFWMGSTVEQIQASFRACRRLLGVDCRFYEREQPLRQVQVSPFFLDLTEVTNQEFAAWLNRRPALQVVSDRLVKDGDVVLVDLEQAFSGLEQRGGRGPDGRTAIRFVEKEGFARKPVVQVTWNGARRYCQDQGKRLPTEAEWEFAARGPEGRTFPWGEQEPRCDGVAFGRGNGLPCEKRGPGVVEVGTNAQDRSPQGVLDLAGNVLEWVQDRYRETYALCEGVCIDPLYEEGGTELNDTARVIRGGDWEEPAESILATRRTKYAQGTGITDVGFRCARSLSR